MKLHLGCGKNPMAGWVNLDQEKLPGVDVAFNLDDCANSKLPYEDDTFTEMFGSHVMEHIRNPLPMMQELHRVAKDGCQLIFRTPYGSSDDAFENPTHVRCMFANSYVYFGQPVYYREDYGYRGDWRLTKVKLFIHKEIWKQLNADHNRIKGYIQHSRNVVTEMVAELVAVKPIRAMKKELQLEAPYTLELAEGA